MPPRSTVRSRSLAAQIGLIMIWGLAQIDETYADDTGFDGDISLSGWLLALVLFILARTFRHGTNLRAEIEGTV